MTIFIVKHSDDGKIIGVFAQSNDAVNMKESFGIDKFDYQIEEHQVIE